MKKNKMELTNPDQFEQMVGLLAEFTDTANLLARLENDLNHEFLKLLKSELKDYAAYQNIITEAEKRIKEIAERNPQWFAKPTIKTPFGTVKRTTGTSLVTESEELSVELISREGELDPRFLPVDYLRTRIELDREALEKLPDDKLRRFGIRRETRTDIKVSAANVDMGKAVEEAIEQEKAA
jgi:hypothetical protein